MTATYDEFSMLGARHAGQYWADGRAAGQWATHPQSPTLSHITWGDPDNWPPPTYERFERRGDWVTLVGYGDTTGRFLPQVVTREQFSLGGTPQPLPADDAGRQHYALWTVPHQPYSLDAWGHMDWEGQRIDFHHHQTWSPPSGPVCANAYFAAQVCIKQFETWADNSGDPGGQLVERTRRDAIFAAGIGPAFVIHDWRTGWHADLRYHWTW